MKVTGLSWLIIALIVLSTILFVVGVSIEHNGEATEGGSDEASEGLEEGEESGEETAFGINLESTPIIISIVVVWVLLIITLLVFGSSSYIVISIIALLATIFDIGEVMRKLGENNLVAIFAILVTLSHLAIVILSGLGHFRK